MKRIVRPPRGFPWEQPGFTFQVGWPLGYDGAALPELTTEEKRELASRRGAVSQASREVTVTMRRGELQAIPKGRGTLGPMSTKTDAQFGKQDKLRRGRAI